MPHNRRPHKIPDLRFEQSFLNSIRKFTHVEDEQVRIDWMNVLWITCRDQVISPMLQGSLWALAVALVIPSIRRCFRTPLHTKEGTGAGWLRKWAQNFIGPVWSIGSPPASRIH